MGKLKLNKAVKIFLLALSFSCSKVSDPMKDYQGIFEYHDGTEIILAASPVSSKMYAILDHAKYPLDFQSDNIFLNLAKTKITFIRNESNEVIGFKEGNSDLFKKVADTILPKSYWYPQLQLNNNSEKYVYRMPKDCNDGLKVGKPEDINSQPLIEMVKKTIEGEYPDVHSILIVKDGKLIFEEYFYGYNKDKLHQLRSATKPFIGLLVGIAIDQGKIISEDQKVLPFFKSSYPEIENVNKQKENISIKDLLTYKHGMDCYNHDEASAGYELKMDASADWVSFTLNLPMEVESGKKSVYCSGCPAVLGRLVELQTQQPLEQFAEENLFKPLGIKDYEWRFDPDSSSRFTFCQLYLKPRDMAKIGMLYLNKGKWNGVQIVSEEWINKSKEKHSEEYGFLFEHNYYMVDGKKYESIMASGNGGQKINIWPELNMVTVFTGGNYNSYLLYGKETPPNEMIPTYILKAF